MDYMSVQMGGSFQQVSERLDSLVTKSESMSASISRFVNQI